jgi:type I restriction enzyme S subunit
MSFDKLSYYKGDPLSLPKGWEIKPLGELVNIKTGKLDSNAMVDGGRYPFFTCSREIFAINDYAFDCEAILLAGNNASGDFNVKHYKGKFNAYQRTYVITVNDKNKILYSYLYQQLTNHLKKFKEQSLGANTKFLKIGMIQGMEIPLPPLPEQQRIVSILDECFAAIAKAKANAEQNLKNVKELFESYLQGVFEMKGEGWEERKLNEVFELKPQKKEARDKLKETDLVTFLPMEDLGVLNKEIVGVKERKLKDVSGSYTYFAENDVLLAKITPCFENGKIGIARNLINGVGFGSSEYIVFRSQGSIEPEYLYYFLSRNHIREEGRKYMSGAVGHKRVSKEWIENFLISFPKSLKSQQTLVRQLDALRAETQKLEAIYQQKLLNLEELKKSVLQKAFAGELKTEKALTIE